MRWLPKAIPVLIAVIALDFAMVFGFEAWRILYVADLGLERPAFANTRSRHRQMGRSADNATFSAGGFFGVINLAIAVICGCIWRAASARCAVGASRMTCSMPA